jgi:hypothetical protein
MKPALLGLTSDPRGVGDSGGNSQTLEEQPSGTDCLPPSNTTFRRRSSETSASGTEFSAQPASRSDLNDDGSCGEGNGSARAPQENSDASERRPYLEEAARSAKLLRLGSNDDRGNVRGIHSRVEKLGAS